MRAPLRIASRLVATLLIVGVPRMVSGQLANASTAATALSGAFTARAQGYNAVAWNPANLAMPGNPLLSFTVAGFDGVANLKPIDINRIGEYSGKVLPASVRNQWLADVAADSGENGGIKLGITELGLSIGRLAIQGSTTIVTRANLAPDIVEAILFGNAGQTPGTVKNFKLTGSGMHAAAYSTGAVSYGMPLPKLVPLANFAVGMTAKYTVGHGLIMGYDDGSVVDTTIAVKFAGVAPKRDANGEYKDYQMGHGIGIDLGAAWTIPRFRFGVNVQNLVNTFKWDTTKLVSRVFSQGFGHDSVAKDSLDHPYANAPASIRQRVADLTFKPAISAGMAFSPLPKMVVSADLRQQFGGEGLDNTPKTTIGVGAEYRIIPFIPLRAGVSMLPGGFGASGGFGLNIFGFEASVAAFIRHRDGGSEPGMTLNVVSIQP